MSNVQFYEKMGFNTLEDCCCVLGSVPFDILTMIYHKSINQDRFYDELFFYENLRPLYDNMISYVNPDSRNEDVRIKIINSASELEKMVKPYFTDTVFQNIINYLEKYYNKLGFKIEDVIIDFKNTKWNKVS